MPGRWSTASFLSPIASAAAARSCSSGTLEKPYWNDEPPRPSPCETSMTGTPAAASPPTTARTCSGVNWCAMAWLPSRSVVSQIRGLTSRATIFLPSPPPSPRGRGDSLPLAPHSALRAGGDRLAAPGQEVLRELLADLDGRGGHDVQVARVGR